MARSIDVLSHWHQSVEGLSISSLEFYDALEKALREKEATSLTSERIEWAEGGVMSDRRTYFRISQGRLVFDVCAAPFGKDFFFSWWMGRKRPEFASLIGCLAIVGLLLLFIVSIWLAGVFKGLVLFLILATVALLAVQRALSDSGIDDVFGAIPYVGPVYTRFFCPATYYSEDTRIMFEETVHRVVLGVLSGVLTLHKMEPLTPDSMKPQRKHSFSTSNR